jgi:alanyl-tRNA synthetase
MLKAKPEEVVDRFQNVLMQLKTMEKDLSAARAKARVAASDTVLSEVKVVNGISVLAQEVSADTPAALRDMADHVKAKIKSGIVVLGSRTPDKALLITVVTKDHLERYHAGKIVKQVAAMVGGGGGGRPDMAQAGGSEPDRLPQALAAVYDIIAEEG